MRKQVFRIGGGILALALLAAIPLYSQGKKGRDNPIPLTLHVYETVIDEQNTIAFSGELQCPGYPTFPTEQDLLTGDWDSRYRGDIIPGSSTPAYEFGDPPWTLVTNVELDKADFYADGAQGVQVRIEQGRQTMSLITDGSSRQMTVDLSSPCDNDAGDIGCPVPPGNTADVVGAFGQTTVTRPGLLNLFMVRPYSTYTEMVTCTDRACREAGLAVARFWFKDPAGNTWRLNWGTVRVLRMDANTWYFIADQCDGTQVAGLSNLGASNRKRPKEVFNGYYKVPFFLVAKQPQP